MESSDFLQQGAQLETVIIFTSRMEELAGFYKESLDIGPYERSPQHMGCRVGPVYLGFDQVDGSEACKSGISLWCTVDNIKATFDRLVKMGAEVRYPPTRKSWGALLASVYDLDGNILGLKQREVSEDSTDI